MSDWFGSVASQPGLTIGRNVTPSYTYSTAAQERDIANYLKEQKRQSDREYKQKQNEIDKNYKIAKENARTARERNEIDRWYNEQSIQNAKDRLAQEDRHFQADLEFQKQVNAEQLGLSQAKLGYDVLSTAANMRGADDYFQASNYARGVANDPNSATFLNALKNNARMPDFTAPAGTPDAFTLNSLMTRFGTPLGAGAAAGSTASVIPGMGNATDDRLREIHALGEAGGHKLGNLALEQLSPDELKLLKSGLEAPLDGKAFNFNDFMSQYQRSRIGQRGGAGYAVA